MQRNISSTYLEEVPAYPEPCPAPRQCGEVPSGLQRREQTVGDQPEAEREDG